MTNKQEHKHCTPEQLYLKMLEIGSECISCGIRYHDLKSKLCSQGLYNSDESDETIKILFENSFSDRNSTCLKPYYEEEKPCDSKYGNENDEHFKFNHLENCVHYLTNEALMNLLHLRESTNNRKTSSNAKITSFVALSIALISLFSDWYNKDNPNEILNSTEFQDVKEKISNISTQSNSQSTILNQLQDDIKPTLTDTTTLKNILKTVKSIDKNKNK